MGLCRKLLGVAWLFCTLSFFEEATALSSVSRVTKPSLYCWRDLCQELAPDRSTYKKKQKQCKDCPILNKRPIRKEHVDLAVTCSLDPSFSVSASFNLSKIQTFGLENLNVVVGYKEKNDISEEVIETIDLGATTFELADVQTNKKYIFCLNITHNHMSSYDESSICHVRIHLL